MRSSKELIPASRCKSKKSSFRAILCIFHMYFATVIALFLIEKLTFISGISPSACKPNESYRMIVFLQYAFLISSGAL